MKYNVAVKNKETGEILNTKEHGIFVSVTFEADGTIDIDEIGVCIDTSTMASPDTKEEYFNEEKYEIVSIKLIGD